MPTIHTEAKLSFSQHFLPVVQMAGLLVYLVALSEMDNRMGQPFVQQQLLQHSSTELELLESRVK